MVFRHEGWILYKRVVQLKDGNQTIFFFSKRTPKSGTPCDLPEGQTVGMSRRTGFPYLKRI